jgi:hypothetical protein
MAVSTAEDLYEMAKQLPAGERLRLVEKIAHDLVPAVEPEAAVPAATSTGATMRLHLAGQVTDLALDPPCFTVRTPRGPVVVQVGANLLDAARDAWGKEALVVIDAVEDDDGAVLEAVAFSIEPVLEAYDPLAVFESTFGSGSEIWSSPEGQEHLEGMRGGS